MKFYIVTIITVFLFNCEKSNNKFKETENLITLTRGFDVNLQKEMAIQLYDFYNSNGKNYNFCEIKHETYFLMNYNYSKKRLCISDDICSGWSAYYVNVSPEKLAEIGKKRILFDELDNYLTRENDISKWSIIDSNGCKGI
jgi:hypothetical protein